MNDIEPDLDGIAERLRTERPIPEGGVPGRAAQPAARLACAASRRRRGGCGC